MCVLLAVLTPSTYAATPLPNTPAFFETHIRPILATNCYSCHAASQLGGLRLDSRDAILKGGKSGSAVVPGDPDKSLLIQAVRQTNPKLKMPMGGKLKDSEIEDLTAWVKAGATWPTAPAPVKAVGITPEQRAFWSFQPLKLPPVPTPKDAAWPKTDIDRFVLAKLERESLKPVATADKRTLIRRATLDLTGLPPTIEETEAFEKDPAPDAFAKVIDRLLASPRYGERWGRFWLDVARYGEDDYRSLDPMRRGYNPYPFAYLYRDWVIKAFNDDMPYDLFVKAQLAADLLDEKSRAKLLPALGFLGQGPWFYDNGSVEVTRADERHDRVDVVSRGFLGLTVGCARCHDHKYDPIPTKDYYALSGVFLNSVYHEYPQVPQSVADEYKKTEKEIESRQKLLGEFMSTEGLQLGETLAFQSAKYMQSAWKVKGRQKAEIATVVEQDKLDFELFERWLRFLEKPPKNYPYLTAWQEMIKKGGTAPEARKLAEEFQKTLVAVMFEHHEIKDENEIIAAKALPGTKKKQRANLPNEFVTNDDFCPGCGLELKTLPIEKMNLWVDVFQRDLSEGEDPAQMPERVKPGLLVFRGWSLERQLSAERRAYIDALRADIDAMRKSQPAHFPYVHGVTEAEKPQEPKVNLRGSPFNLGDEVPRHFLSVLSDQPVPLNHGSGRLDLAEQIVAQPIAMRVIVNRIWRAHFGTGIVDSPSNFGMTGERPTNPELLEYLAKSFVDNGMSVKKLHREILLSAVYQLSDENSKENFDKDSGNRLYWRANRHRMDAEQIRDSILAVAGDLDLKIGGPSATLTPDYTRRTVYGKVSRYRLDDYLQLFDFPSPNLSAEKRFATTVPLQRLFFMNSDFVQQQAEHLAQRVAAEPDQTARIQKAYRLVYGRAATPEEVKIGLEYLRAEPMKEYEEQKAAKKPKPDSEPADADKPDMPQEFIPGGMMSGVRGRAPAEPKKPQLPITAWGRYAKVLLSSSEFLFVN
ncbi:MAG TPA: PSD1 and planctomycete cytochrome C domain-containing protein [Bryobacteraceae bacterium]|nr:PSD1 and planctomycete cytochrome C domain-containing protein [Bryobacteraceae bacterium]